MRHFSWLGIVAPPMKRSIVHLPDYKQLKLRQMRDVILEVGREGAHRDKVAMIILFGSHARGDWVDDETIEGQIIYGYHSDYDILVVVADRKQAHQRAALAFESAVMRRLWSRGVHHSARHGGGWFGLKHGPNRIG